MYKNKIYTLLAFILMICTFSIINIKAKELPLTGKIIYVDPGHGGIC